MNRVYTGAGATRDCAHGHFQCYVHMISVHQRTDQCISNMKPFDIPPRYSTNENGTVYIRLAQIEGKKIFTIFSKKAC